MNMQEPVVTSSSLSSMVSDGKPPLPPSTKAAIQNYHQTLKLLHNHQIYHSNIHVNHRHSTSSNPRSVVGLNLSNHHYNSPSHSNQHNLNRTNHHNSNRSSPNFPNHINYLHYGNHSNLHHTNHSNQSNHANHHHHHHHPSSVTVVHNEAEDHSQHPRQCLCSPTTHEGSFRCRLHRSNTNTNKNSTNIIKPSSSSSKWPNKVSKITSHFHSSAGTSIEAQ